MLAWQKKIMVFEEIRDYEKFKALITDHMDNK
jgi:hypothetical protein